MAAVNWLRARRRADLAQKLVPPGRARTDETLLLAHCELLADQRRWSDLDALLQELKLPLNPVARASLRALHAHGTGRPEEAAGKVTQLLQVVAGFAEQMGQPAIAGEAWTIMLEDPLTVVPAAAVLLRQARSREDLVVEHLVYRHLLVPLGQQSEVRSQHAYLRVLFNEQVAEAETELTALVTQNLGDLRLRTALALAKLRLGKAEEALALCETGGVEWERQEPRWRAVYAAALLANQQRAAARKFALAVPLEQLKLPERALLQETLKKL